jgi:hypothetical protein
MGSGKRAYSVMEEEEKEEEKALGLFACVPKTTVD